MAAGQTITLQSEIAINANVSIIGPEQGNLDPPLVISGRVFGAGETLSGNRVFTVGFGKTLQLYHLTLKTGAASGIDRNGGLVRVDTGATLTCQRTWFEEGVAQGDGGGVWVGSGATFTLRNGGFFKNQAAGDGGGVAFVDGYKFQIFDSLVEENKAGQWGGGFWVRGAGHATEPRGVIERVGIGRNFARHDEGGVYVSWGTGAQVKPFEITTSHVDSNAATRGYGGGVITRGNVSIAGGTFNNNTARFTRAGQPVGADGVGIHVYSGTTTLNNVRAANNKIVDPDAPPENAGGEPGEVADSSAVYVAPGAEGILVESLDVDGGDAGSVNTLWNAGLVNLTATEDRRDIGTVTVTGNYTQTGTGILAIDLVGAGTSDQLAVAGAANHVTLAGGLELHPQWATPPARGTVFVIIRNDTSHAVDGIFDGLPEGEEFWLAGAKLKISYNRSSGGSYGDPDDVILTVVTPPAVVTGYVFYDGYQSNFSSWDGNGIRDTPGGYIVLVEILDANNTVVAYGYSDNTGHFSIDLDDPGTYRVKFSLPPAGGGSLGTTYVFSTPNSGAGDPVDNDANAAGLTGFFTAVLGETTTLDAGVVMVYSM